ncbi:ABC transporter permease [Bergeyella porcorum]|uniref:ABC transporter permease n=1 Tax=Bergeyella porcorum TaxID=1735111 RepID=A0AAU0EZQ3_9FLAO
MLPKIKVFYQKVMAVVHRYPNVLVLALIAAVSAVVGVALDHRAEALFKVVKFTLIVCWGISLMFASCMYQQRQGRNVLWDWLALLPMVLLYYILPDDEQLFTEVHRIIILVCGILSHLLVAFVPFLGKNNEIRFWQYNKNLFINFILTGIFTGVLVGGLELAIAATDNLFELNLRDETFLKVFFFVAILGSSFIFLMFNDGGLTQLEQGDDYPLVLKFFTQFVLIPLLIIYALILYGYMLKIGIRWELPRGWVSYMILAYAVFGILALLLVHPLKNEHSKSWVKVFSKVFYYALIPLLGLLYVAIFTRILEYGYTEARYFVLLTALWLTSIVVYFVVFRKANIKFIPISLFILGLAALVFPYFNAFSVAKRSQKQELMKLLEDNQLLSNGVIDFKKKISQNKAYEISDKVFFLSERDEKEWLYPYIPKEKLKEFKQYHSILPLFETVVMDDGTKKEDELVILESKQSGFPVEGYQYVLPLQYVNDFTFNVKEDTFRVFRHPTNDIIYVVLNDKETMDINALVLEKYQSHFSESKEENWVDSLFVEGKLGRYEVKVIISKITKYSNEKRIYPDGIYVLIK